MTNHAMRVQIFARRVVINCECGWMQIMPRRSNVIEAMRVHREIENNRPPTFQQRLSYIGAALVER